MQDVQDKRNVVAIAERIPADVQREILRAIASIEYGSVEVIIHGARVVQIESRAKLRVGGDK
ncbi:MAG: YezD family protein [Burkholderiales bacterium]